MHDSFPVFSAFSALDLEIISYLCTLKNHILE